MAYDDTDSPFDSDAGRAPRREISQAAVSITPIPVDDVVDNLRSASSTRSGKPASAPPVSAAVSFDEDDQPSQAHPQPSRAVAKYLFASEKYSGEWRRHWIHVAGWGALGLISPFIVGYLVGILGSNNKTLMWIILGIWVLVLLVVLGAIFQWWIDRFVLTNKRVMLVTGLLTRRVAMMPLARVTDMAYEQSPLGMMLGYGTFILESAGQDQALREIKPLPHPNELYLLFCQEMYDPGSVDEGAEENASEGDNSAD